MDQIFFKPRCAVVAIAIVAVAAIAMIFSTTESFAAQTTAVTATVGSTVSCTPDGNVAALGALSSGSVTTATPQIVVTNSCNSGGGCVVYVNDAGDTSLPGLHSSATGTPLIASATATLVAGTEGYGIQATTTSAGTGAALTLAVAYNKSGNAVGGLFLAATQIASASSPFASKVINVDTKAAVSITTASGNYADTITYSCTGQ